MKKELLVDGMHCENCANRIKKVLGSIEEIKDIDVNLDMKKVIITLNKEIDDTIIKKKIEDLGFEVKEIN